MLDQKPVSRTDGELEVVVAQVEVEAVVSAPETIEAVAVAEPVAEVEAVVEAVAEEATEAPKAE
jgi:hypothetical protein